MISVENLTKSFGARVLFDGVSFKINSRERVGLLGRNGHGKTTLFRILSGQEDYDGGRFAIPRNYRIGYVEQQLVFTQPTVLAEGMQGLPADARDHHWKVEKILAGLGFDNADLQRHPAEFSGGFQVRLNLAKALVAEPDLLLLDEPTNYLDIAAIRWVERFLQNWQHELMLITHDRSFMDKVVTHTLGLYRQKVRKITGDTGKYYAQIAQEEEIYEKTRANDERRRKEVELFISRFRAKARLANMVQSRIKTLSKMEKKDRLEKLKTLDFSFRSRPFRGRTVLGADGVTFGYDPDRPLIADFSIAIGPGQRVCVIGKNGRGKTTLLKLLAGTLTPQAGAVTYHPAVERGVFEQTNVASLVDSRTVEEEILYAAADVDRQLARNICGAMLFEQDEALKKVGVLSGGEKSRVMLGKLLVTPINLLLLDEPTNHLDMESCDALLAAIDSFDGTVVMVTHNEMFLHALAERLVVFTDTGIEVFEGSYQDFLAQDGWHDGSGSPPERAGSPAAAVGAPALSKKELRRRRSEVIAQRAQALKPLESRIRRSEEEIERHEKKVADYSQALLEASRAQDGERIGELSRGLHHSQGIIDARFDELEGLYRERDAKAAVFQALLDDLGGDVPGAP